MPNIQQLLSLKGKYSQLTDLESDTKTYLDKEIIKEISSQSKRVFSFSEKSLLEHLTKVSTKPDLIKYFDSKPTELVVLLFIDITGFSIKAKDMVGLDVANYLDDYYKKSIPIIYKAGGQIEKLMGDGIICVFGKPFINDDRWETKYKKAENCAKQLIRLFHETDKEVKVALHSGKITYYKIPGDYYEEYTMVGKPLTDLFRLESVSKNNGINFYNESIYGTKRNNFTSFEKGTYSTHDFDVNLPGVNYKSVCYLKFSNL